MNSDKKIDLLTVGRSSIDLYSANIGSPFEEIKQFDAFVGGSPLNIAVGGQRLGLNTSLFTAIGDDKVGDFILNFLHKEGVDVQYIPRLKNRRSSAVVLGIEPPDKYPLVYYRDNAADIGLEIAHAEQINLNKVGMIEASATALCGEPSRSATFYLAQQAQKMNIPIVLDIDFRADQWHDIRSFGVNVRAFLQYCTIAIGTREEVLAAVLVSKDQLVIKDQQISAPEITGDPDEGIETILQTGVEYLIYKDGKEGCKIHKKEVSSVKVPGFPVEVLNVLGAGDAFAAGFCYGYINGWSMPKSCRLANACGAYLVTQPGCANFNPTYDQINQFIESKGGY